MLDPLLLPIADLPGALQDQTVLMVADLHVRGRRRRFEILLDAIAARDIDLLVLLGDFMHAPGDEPMAHEYLQRLVRAAAARVGAFGVFGNHDSPELRRRLGHLPVHWLSNEAWTDHHLPLQVFGVDCGFREKARSDGDLLGALGGSFTATHRASAEDAPLRVLLSHRPDWFPAAADAGIDLLLSGHTHGGQVRLPGLGARFNATPGWPNAHSSGVLQINRS
ncbi:MAG: metallophosphoesterase, partial [Phycisphaerae bacterium]|nr:metallophosphoesterase [Phycisphaerae bacterium]